VWSAVALLAIMAAAVVASLDATLTDLLSALTYGVVMYMAVANDAAAKAIRNKSDMLE